MAKEYINKETQQFEDSTVVDQEVQQYKRLRAAGINDDKELAHRLPASLKTVRRLRKYIGD